MSKVVVYLLIATAILGFIVFSPCNPNEEPNARLNRRLGFMLQDRAPHFDPLMVKIKTHPPRSLDNSSSVKDVADTYQYLTSAGRLNTTLRLIILFPLLDREPKDGAVSFNELQAWITQRAFERLDYVTQAELDSKDMDQDSSLSFREYLPNFSQNDIEKREMGHGEAGWWMEKFNTADIDHNAVLNFTELRDFLHPEDSENQNMLKWLLRDRLKLLRRPSLTRVEGRHPMLMTKGSMMKLKAAVVMKVTSETGGQGVDGVACSAKGMNATKMTEVMPGTTKWAIVVGLIQQRL
ncbi:uncharacterized protein [Arachis hypogaea]|uniref:EF-hand domain-containing protein n=1 Tax=Arachis hypogaea TaxID=3818 RepID=A0A444WWI4_ARAHY|nr:hypothetical protein Ahy_B10g100405 [Arachis hypogaea]